MSSKKQYPVMFRVRPINYANQTTKKKQGYKKYYIEYLRRKEAMEKMYEYDTKRYGATGLFDMNGNDLNEQGVKALKKQFESTKGIVWDMVISFDTKFALDHHITDADTAKSLLKYHLENLMISHPYIKKENLMSCFSFHTNTDNPHIQGFICEKEHHRFQPRLDLAYMNDFKHNIEQEAILLSLKKAIEPELTLEQKQFEQRLKHFLATQDQSQQLEPEMRIKEYYVLDKLLENKQLLPTFQYQRYNEYQNYFSESPEQLIKKVVWENFLNENKFRNLIEKHDYQFAEIRNHPTYQTFELNFINQLKQNIKNQPEKFLINNAKSKKLNQAINFDQLPANHQPYNKRQAYYEKAIDQKIIQQVNKAFNMLLTGHSKSLAKEQGYLLNQLQYERQLARNKQLQLEFKK